MIKITSPKNDEERELMMARALAAQMEGLPSRVIFTAALIATGVDFQSRFVNLVVGFKKELRERAEAHENIKKVLREEHPVDKCREHDCPICGIILCPFDAPEHTWKDGCPQCYGTAVDPIPEPVP